jgi:head-tail adaptor
MLSTGTLDRRITLERNVPEQDLAGELTENWQRIGHVRWARRAPVGGDERYTSTQFIAREQVQWTIRWTEDLADLAPGDRLIYPTTLTPSDTEIYDIIAVHEMGWRVALNVVTARRTEALVT